MARQHEWTHVESLPPGGRISPYIHWTSAWSHSDQAFAAQDLLDTDIPWLAHAIQTAIGDASDPWGRLLHHVLPRHAVPSGAPESDPEPAKSTSAKVLNLPPANDRVILGIIDDATAFAHERFRLPNGRSRIDYLWLQSARHEAAAPFGREYDRTGIERLIDQFRRGPMGEMIDEDGLYRHASALDMSLGTPQSLARTAGHGTAVADLAASFGAAGTARGRDRFTPPGEMNIAPEDFDLAIVSLPERLIMDTSGTFAEIFMILGMVRLISHVENRSQREGKDYPLVINISLGLTAGPRDGTSLLDRFIAAVNAQRPSDRVPIRIVVPAGNFRQAKVHAVLDAPVDEKASPLFWTIAPDDSTPSFLEIWSTPLPRKPEVLPISLTLRPAQSKEAAPLGPVPLDGVFDLSSGPQLAARCYTQWVPKRIDKPSAGGRVRLTLAVPPTLPGNPARAYTVPGPWQLLLEPANASPSQSGWPLDLVVQRDDMIPGYRGGGRQSYLQDRQYMQVDARGFTVTKDRPGPDGTLPYVRRAGTINAFATAPEIVVVGGCYADTLEPVDYSGEGGSGGQGLRGIDASASASMQRMRGVIRAAGSRSGSRIGVGGTSIAAPVMSRELAKAMRPLSERPKLSGVSLLRRSSHDTDPPPVLPITENLSDRYQNSSGAHKAISFSKLP
ncbi:hypothetical protein [Primorskyibacter flagellatus]|uniref:Peptidase S8/S53 domain-containing protein n=1 Tax=Primorskyibacter flagellatus TaxID=1387277 RepID=A0A1W1Z463_9RHOB|nr:hypothetical protein [Primorskyibacter flagellatus]SMC43267.1 hypothetical protein SAMN06295998_101230 [Primorskyibacter flagellatus]